MSFKRVDLAAAAAQRRAAMEKEQEEKRLRLLEKERERMARAEAARLQTINKKATAAKATTPVRERVSQRRAETESCQDLKAQMVLETEKEKIAKADAMKREAMLQASLAARKSNRTNEVLVKKSAIDEETTRHIQAIHHDEERKEELAQVQRRESLLSRVATAQTTTHTDLVQRNKERQEKAAKARAAQEQARLERAGARRQEMLAERAARASHSPHVHISSRTSTPATSPTSTPTRSRNQRPPPVDLSPPLPAPLEQEEVLNVADHHKLGGAVYQSPAPLPPTAASPQSPMAGTPAAYYHPATPSDTSVPPFPVPEHTRATSPPATASPAQQSAAPARAPQTPTAAQYFHGHVTPTSGTAHHYFSTPTH